MSQSFGDSGRPPQRPPRGQKPAEPLPRAEDDSFGFAPRQPASDELDLYNDDESEQWTGRALRKPVRASGTRRRKQEQEAVALQHIEPSKRLVALVFDSLACYTLGMMLTVVPLLVHFISVHTTWLLLLLVRDYLFHGRGIGKNLMGLQIVDAKTGAPCSIKQSVLRNIIILAPFAVLQLISVILAFLPIPWLNEAVKSIVNVVGMVYLAAVVPIECYRVYSREDSLRLGDVWAGTAVIEAPMDFSRPFQK